MRVSVVVVSHRQPEELTRCLAALEPQVDELVVVANLPSSLGELPEGTRVLESERPCGFASNVNAGALLASGDALLVANPDTVAYPGAVAALVEQLASHPRCGIVGPELRYPDGRWQPSRRRFPTVGGTLVRRTPLRLLFRPQSTQRRHYLLDERPRGPVQADWLLGAFLLIRRAAFDELGGFDDGFRLYCEDIDLCYRAAQAGWERWYVPGATVEHAWQAETDRRFLSRRTLWHWRGMFRFVRKHPRSLLPSR